MSNNDMFIPWKGHAFHCHAMWSSPTDCSHWVAADSLMSLNGIDMFVNNTFPQIFITGGGYLGKQGSNDIVSLEGYSDMWWSNEGSK